MLDQSGKSPGSAFNAMPGFVMDGGAGKPHHRPRDFPPLVGVGDHAVLLLSLRTAQCSIVALTRRVRFSHSRNSGKTARSGCSNRFNFEVPPSLAARSTRASAIGEIVKPGRCLDLTETHCRGLGGDIPRIPCHGRTLGSCPANQ